MPVDINAIDWFSLVLVAILVASAIIGFEKFVSSGSNLKHKFVDAKFEEILNASTEGDETIRTEILTFMENSRREHDRYEEYFDNDKRTLARHDRELDDIKADILVLSARLDQHNEEGTITLKAIRSLINTHLGIGSDSDMIEIVNEMDEFLIERRKQ